LRRLRKATEQGLAEALFKSAALLLKGKNELARNTSEAALWFSKAADQGHERGKFNTAVFLYGRDNVAGTVQ
jgi:TPR repeat protein